MDTFCIPTFRPNDHNATSLKSRAISRMALVYAGAKRVLVLDSGVQNLRFEALKNGWNNDVDIAAQILTSGWMGRSWTLQEAVLARSCFFVLASGPWSIKSDTWLQAAARRYWFSIPLMVEREGCQCLDFIEIRSADGQKLKKSPLIREAIRRADEMTRLVAREVQDDKRWFFSEIGSAARKHPLTSFRLSQFVRTWNTLRHRSTSQPHDRHGIFANLMDFNAHQVLALPSSFRLPGIIRSCSELPLSLLYNHGPRIQQGGEFWKDCWIPTEVTGSPLIKGGILRLVKIGLSVHFDDCPVDTPAVYLIKAVAFGDAGQFRIQDEHNGRQYLVAVEESGSGRPRFYNSCSMEPQTLEECQMAIVIDKRTGSDSIGGYSGTGVQFIVSRVQESIYFLQYYRPLTIWNHQQWLLKHSSLPSQCYIEPNLRHNLRFIIECG
jgi:hypothetical protein